MMSGVPLETCAFNKLWNNKFYYPIQPWQLPVTTWVYKPEAANTVQSSWWWAVCRSKHVEPSINFGIINSITKLHLAGISTESSTRHGSMNIKYSIFLSDFNGIWVFRQIFEKYSHIQFHEIPFSGSQVPRAPTDGLRQTDMTQLIVAFNNFANAPKIEAWIKKQTKRAKLLQGLRLVKTPLKCSLIWKRSAINLSHLTTQ